MAAKSRIVDVDHGWKAIVKGAKSMAVGDYSKVGVLADTSKGGFTEPGSALTVAEIAAINELGTDKIPARSFLGSTFDEKRGLLEATAAKGIARILDGKLTTDQVLGIMGAQLAAETKKTITDSPLPGVLPINAPSTLLRKAKKGRTKKFFKAKPSKNEGKNFGNALAQAAALESVRTLVDTGRMVNAITWQVVKGSGAQGSASEGTA